jgi:phage-related protein (TIGR01555 family)
MAKNPVLTVIDGWKSILTGFGVSGKDKLYDFLTQWDRPIENYLENDYAGDDVTGRLIDEIPNEGTRSWTEIIGATSEQEKLITNLENKLDVIHKHRHAWVWSRLYGGSVILINTNVDSADLAKPLNLKSEGGEIKALTVLHRFELQPDSSSITSDIASSNFGLPEFYQLTSSVGNTSSIITKIHYSRLIRFDGSLLPRQKFRENNYWHDSFITKCRESIRNYNVAHMSSVAAAVDFSVPVIKMKNLADIVYAGKKDVIESRVHTMNMCKSMMRMILLDESETLEYLTRTVTGLPELVSKAEDRLVMSTKMPRTKILGESPKGLQGDGKSEDRQWYDLVSQERERVIEKPYTKLFNLFLEQLKLPTTISYKFKPLWQQSDQEKATTYKTYAEADQIYLANGVISQATVQESRFGGDEFGTEITLTASDKDIELEEETPKEEKPTPNGEQS